MFFHLTAASVKSLAFFLSFFFWLNHSSRSLRKCNICPACSIWQLQTYRPKLGYTWTSAGPPFIQIMTPLFWKCCKSSWGCRFCVRASAWWRPAGRMARALWNRARWLARWGIRAGARRQRIPDSLRSEPGPAPSAPECPDIEHHSHTDEAKTEGFKRNRLEVLLHNELNTTVFV